MQESRRMSLKNEEEIMKIVLKDQENINNISDSLLLMAKTIQKLADEVNLLKAQVEHLKGND